LKNQGRFVQDVVWRVCLLSNDSIRRIPVSFQRPQATTAPVSSGPQLNPYSSSSGLPRPANPPVGSYAAMCTATAQTGGFGKQSTSGTGLTDQPAPSSANTSWPGTNRLDLVPASSARQHSLQQLPTRDTRLRSHSAKSTSEDSSPPKTKILAFLHHTEPS
jgi:hypothetical protein